MISKLWSSERLRDGSWLEEEKLMYAYEHHNAVIYMQQLAKQRRAMENSTAQKELITFVHNYFLWDEILDDGFVVFQSRL